MKPFFALLKTTVLNLMLAGFILSSGTAFAKVPSETLDFDNVDLRTVLRVLAKWTGRSVILSPAIKGPVSLHLHQVSFEDVFQFLLKSQSLEMWQLGRLSYLAPREILLKEKQEEAKWQSALEEASPLHTRFWRARYTKAVDLAAWLKTGPSSLLSKRGQVQVDGRSNTLGVRDTAAHLALIQDLVDHLDVPLQQIIIETRLASVDSDYEEELGLRFSTVKETVSRPGQFSLVFARLADLSFLDIKLAALEKEGHGELISSPSLFTASQQSASIEAGEELPYQEASSSGATTVVFKKAVLSLKVTPELLPGKKILLQLQIHQDRPNARLVLGVPAISTRQLHTQVLIPNGQTVVLGGIYEISKENSRDNLPFLAKIPVLGWLFQVKHQRRSKRELLIFVTPRVIEW